MQAKKHILLIGTGGTITAEKIDNAWSPGKLSEQAILELIPEIKVLVTLDTINLFNIDSVSMQPKYWVKIAKAIEDRYADYDGFVVLHGTDTLHYTAAALSFLIQNPTKPIVLTGSMIPAFVLGTDARRNIVDALRVASETAIHEIVIVFNRKILRGNRAKKFREMEFDAYQSIGMPPIGVIEQDIRFTSASFFTRAPTEGPHFYHQLEPNVCIQKITPGYNPQIFPGLIGLGYRGIITEGFGSGNLPNQENSLVEEIQHATAAGVPIIVCSQCAIGFSWMDLYESGKSALNAGAIPGYDMISETAMVKLMWVLGNFPGISLTEIHAKMLADIAGEISKFKSPKEKRVWEYAF